MIYPIVIYGNSILRKKAEPIEQTYPNLDLLIKDMYQTLNNADGVGLAAPQIGLSIRLFIIDLSILGEETPAYLNYKRTMINPQILSFEGEDVTMDEGCLSLPGLSETVKRKDKISIEYYDENWEKKVETYEGYPCRVIQHEYDHIEGHVFVDRISPIRKQMISTKLSAMSKGKVKCNYKTKS